MSDPTRLLSAQSDADSLERSLLESLQNVGPSSDAQGAMWKELTAGALAAGLVIASTPTVAASAVANAATGSALSTGAGSSITGATAASAKLSLTGLAALLPKALTVKLVLAGALAAGGVGSYAAYKTRQPAAKLAQATPQRAASRTLPSLDSKIVDNASTAAVLEPVAEAEAAAPVEAAASAPSAAVHHPRQARHPSERLLRESKLLAEARAALRGGDLTLTDTLLAQLRARFPRGGLMQEREVLRIETSFAHGDKLGAQRRAEAFLARHPESPHNLTLRRFLSAP